MKYEDKKNTAKWLEVCLLDSYSKIDELYLYGSVSKLGYGYGIVASFDEDSDFDFAVQDSAELANYLVKEGWEEKPETSYQDAVTKRVFEKVFEGHKVQLGLKEDLYAFKSIWESVPNGFYWDFINKRSPTFIGRNNVANYISQLYFLLKGVYKFSPKKIAFPSNVKFVFDKNPAQFDVQPARWAEVGEAF